LLEVAAVVFITMCASQQLVQVTEVSEADGSEGAFLTLVVLLDRNHS